MRLSQAWIIARHDMGVFRRRRGILAPLVGTPIGIGVGFPLLVRYILTTGAPDPGSWLPSFINAFAFWFVIGAASIPTAMAAYSIVGEKVSKSLEPLLATPSTDGEILFGKALAAFLPTVAALWAGSVIFQVLVDKFTEGPFGYLYYPNAEMTVALLVVMPLAALVAIEACVVISSRATDVRSAQQYASVIIFPFIFLYVAAEVKLTLDATTLLYIAAGLAAVAFALYLASVRTFHREEILTRWK